MDEKKPEHLIIPEAARREAYNDTMMLMGTLNLSMGNGATRRSGEFDIRHSPLNSMHTLLISFNKRIISVISFWLDSTGKGVSSVTVFTPHSAGAVPKLPQTAINYLERIRGIAEKHREAAFMKGPGGRNASPLQARRH